MRFIGGKLVLSLDLECQIYLLQLSFETNTVAQQIAVSIFNDAISCSSGKDSIAILRALNCYDCFSRKIGSVLSIH